MYGVFDKFLFFELLHVFDLHNCNNLFERFKNEKDDDDKINPLKCKWIDIEKNEKTQLDDCHPTRKLSYVPTILQHWSLVNDLA